MFILRQITKDGLELNLSLGEFYQVIYKESHPLKFANLLGKTDHHPDSEKIYAIILYKNESYPLYKGHYYYIMSESGSTFSNITFK